jgi:hypothetical protein
MNLQSGQAGNQPSQNAIASFSSFILHSFETCSSKTVAIFQNFNREYMMIHAKLLAAALLLGATSLSLAPQANAAPLTASAAVLNSAVPAATENVQYYRHRRYYGHRHHHHHGGGTAAGIGLGLAAGAIIGGAIAAGQAQAQQNHAYCAQRYRSYDPRSGTYLNYDGNRYPCP